MITIQHLCAGLAIGLVCSGSPSRADGVKIGGTGAALGLMERLAKAYRAEHPGDAVEVVPGLGSAGAISAVSEGALQVAVSGRPLRPDERARGLTTAPLLDTPVVFVTSHPEPQALTSEGIVAIFGGAIRTWPDGKEIRPILRPRSDAATEFLLGQFEDIRPAMDRLRQRPDVPIAATDQDNAAAAERTPSSFASMTLLQFETEQPRLRPIPLDGVEGSVEAMRTGAYRLKMRLDLVWRTNPGAVTQRFLAFLRSNLAAGIMRQSGGAAVGTPSGRP